jgi:NAD(P)-dependent dehydrogenase (short-subunit alcohol dehydrogenase family)
MEQIWFITGSSRGLGRALVRAAMEAGDLVAATARQPSDLDDLVVDYGERIHPIALDVTDGRGARSASAEAHRHFGRIETSDDEDFRAQFETNFWGVYHVSKAAIPILREQRSGVVMQISSVGGRVGGSPGIASYQAAKFAIDGFSRVLQAETAPFGVKVVVVEPSGFRTDWAGASMTVHEIPEAYAPTVGAMNTRVRQSTDGPAGDPARAAAILVQVAKRDTIPYHLPLGVNAAEGSIRLDEQLITDDRKWRELSRSADFSEPYPVEFPADAPQ